MLQAIRIKFKQSPYNTIQTSKIVAGKTTSSPGMRFTRGLATYNQITKYSINVNIDNIDNNLQDEKVSLNQINFMFVTKW